MGKTTISYLKIFPGVAGIASVVVTLVSDVDYFDSQLSEKSSHFKKGRVFFKGFYKMDMGVSKNTGAPKWTVYNGKPYEQMDDLVVPLFLETPIQMVISNAIQGESYSLQIVFISFLFEQMC